MSPRARLLVLALLLLAATVAPSAASVAADHPPLGAFTQLSGQGGCIGLTGNAHGCAEAPGLSDTAQVEASADGRHLYAFASGQGTGTAIVALALDPVTGAPRATEPAFCVSATQQPVCARDAELWRLSTFAIAPDGRHVYVASEPGADDPARVTTWARDPASGALTRVPGADGCVTAGPTDDGCRHVAGLTDGDAAFPSLPQALVFSRDGANLYAVVSTPVHAGGQLAVLTRDPASGRLTQPSSVPCLAEATPLPAGCQAARALNWASAGVVSPDGRNVYVAGGPAGANAGTVAVFTRGAQGGLSQPSGTTGCVRGSGGDCAPARRMHGALYDGFPAPLAISPDGATVYKGASGAGGGIAVLARDGASGALTQLPGRDGCVAAGAATADCRGATGVGQVWGLEVAPGGDVVAAFDYGGQGGGGHVALLDRAATGALAQRPAPYGCLGDRPDPTCVETPLLRSTSSGAFAPDGGTLYAGGWDSDFANANPIVVLTREAPPVCDDGEAAAVAGQPVELALVCREPNGQPLTRTVVEWPAHGTLRALDDAGRFAYTPDAAWRGDDALRFRASDGAHDSAPARIALTVTAPPADGRPGEVQQPDPDRRVDDRPIPGIQPWLRPLSKGTLRADRRGRLTVVVRCVRSPFPDCTGTVSLRSARRLRLRPRGKAQVVTLARGRRVRVARERDAKVALTLTRQARALLRDGRGLRAVLTAHKESRTVTVKAAAPRRR
jgi:6-phosphogluconolactonase (cycloisomerase 2 family)